MVVVHVRSFRRTERINVRGFYGPPGGGRNCTLACSINMALLAEGELMRFKLRSHFESKSLLTHLPCSVGSKTRIGVAS
jgi:hypothetical protein